jgi:S1-C subfamily serine protease
MRLRLKVLIGILITLITVNCLWVVYDIRKEIRRTQTNVENLINEDRESLNNVFFILDLMNKIDNSLINSIKSTNLTIKNLPETIRINKIKLEQNLKQINIMVVNRTRDSLGSGVSIKYKDKFYVLTAGHMATPLVPGGKQDELYLYENDKEICKLEVVKHDYQEGAIDTTNNDLLLLRPVNSIFQPRFYTEIADKEPITGTQIYIVGNPMGIEDVISDGRIIIYKDKFMYYIDHTYFGNSGGGVYNYDGKLVGIVSHITNLKPMPDAPDYMIAGAVRLNTILTFMKDVI